MDNRVGHPSHSRLILTKDTVGFHFQWTIFVAFVPWKNKIDCPFSTSIKVQLDHLIFLIRAYGDPSK